MTDIDPMERAEGTRGESIFFSPYMGWALLVFVGVSLWFHIIALLFISIFLLVMNLFINQWKKQMWREVYPSLSLSRTRMFCGDTFSLQAALANKKWLPLVWAEWEQHQVGGIRWGREKKDNFRIRLLWLLRNQEISWDIEGEAARRGVYHIGDLTLRAGDPFRFTEEKKSWNLSRTLYVYPALLPVSVPSLMASMPWETSGRKGGILEDPLLIQGVREYETGDEWRRIDWRATAKTGELQTRVFQPVIAKQLYCFLDVNGFDTDAFEDNTEKAASFEWLLSVTASVAVRYVERGVHIGQVTNALDETRNLVAPVLPQENLTPFLDNAARIIPSPAMSTLRLLDELTVRGRTTAPVYFFCDAVTETHYQWVQRHQKEAGRVTFYYVNETTWANVLGNAAQPAETLVPANGEKEAGT